MPPFSVGFYIAYLLCGMSDMLDGTVARKTSTQSELGSKLDTVADLVFVVAAGFKILPNLHLSKWLWAWVIAIAMIKIVNMMVGLIYKKKFVSMHTIMNKTTGLILFLLPLTLRFIESRYSFVMVCLVATFSAIQEGYYIWIGRETI